MNRDRCERDWQGPSDDECVDTLLIVSCDRPAAHDGRHTGVVRCDRPRPHDRHFIPVEWESSTGPLFYGGTQVVYRAQFAEPPRVEEA